MNKIKIIFLLIFLKSFFISIYGQTNITNDTAFANSLFNKAYKFYNNAVYDSALAYYRQGSTIFFEISRQEEKLKYFALDKYFVCLNKQASISSYKGYYTCTLSTCDVVIGHSTLIFGENNKYEAEAYYNKALLNYNYLKQNDTALYYALKRIRIGKINNSLKNPEVAVLYSMIGNIYSDKHNYNLALEYYLKAVDTKIKLSGEKHPDMIVSYSLIGGIYLDKEEYDLALEYYLKSLRIDIELNGVKNPDVANSCNRIGMIYKEKGQYDLALEYYLKSLIIRTELFDETHPDVLQSYVNISEVYHDKSDFNSASEYLLKAINAMEASSNLEYFDFAVRYKNVGKVYRLIGELSLDLQTLLDAPDKRKYLLGEMSSGF
jgi:tetratricopeptide (TPR) repeat protein